MTDTRATVDGPLTTPSQQPVERVFVGIPDVFTAEQFARLQGLGLAERIGTFRFNDEPQDRIAEAIKAADRLATYLLTGEGVQS